LTDEQSGAGDKDFFGGGEEEEERSLIVDLKRHTQLADCGRSEVAREDCVQVQRVLGGVSRCVCACDGGTVTEWKAAAHGGAARGASDKL